MTDQEIVQLSCADLARAIRAKKVTAVRAMEARRDADAIRELLREHDAVFVPEPGQLSLFGDGQ